MYDNYVNGCASTSAFVAMCTLYVCKRDAHILVYRSRRLGHHYGNTIRH